MGVLFHEWQSGQPPWSIHAVTALAALAVVVRPTAVPRVMLMLGLLLVELFVDLPNPWNHLLLAGVVGGGIVAWWLVQVVRARADALDPGLVYDRIAPFLRISFVLAFLIAAFAKLNEGFTDRGSTCAVWVLEQVPLLPVPDSLSGLLIVGTFLLEFSIPIMLLIPRTRPLGIALGFGFHLISAAGGHTAFSGFAWSFYLLFLSKETIARAALVARDLVSRSVWRRLQSLCRSPWAWPVLVVAWLVALGLLQVLPGEWELRGRRWGAALPYFAYAFLWAWLLVGNRARLLLVPSRGVHFRVRDAAFVVALAVLIVNAASPYLGLKTRYSLTMYSNLQTEPGRWNHLIVPEGVRRFDWQEGLVRLVSTDDPKLSASIRDLEDKQLVLMDARRLLRDHPSASLVYEYDGVRRRADPVRSDPVVGDQLARATQLVSGFRPVAGIDLCQH